MVLFRCVTGGTGGFEIAITTEDTDLYGQTITISKNGSTVGTTVFDNTGNASYTVTETGTYSVSVTYDGRTVTETVEVTAFAVDLAMGFVLEKWLEFGDISGTYASLSDVLADEDAVRQLMTIHDAVDYLASFEATDASVVTILNDNYSAKWISLTDYAMDTLEAAYGTLMGTIGKYGYGEWGITDATTTPPTWGALGNVPVMTSNSAPYGTASANTEDTTNGYFAYCAFKDTSEWDAASGVTYPEYYIQYQFPNPVRVRAVSYTHAGALLNTVKVVGSNDGTNWSEPLFTHTNDTSIHTNQMFTFANDEYYLYYRFVMTGTYRMFLNRLQFYGRTLKVSVPKMSGNTTPYGAVDVTNYISGGSHAGFKAFDGGTPSTSDHCWVGYDPDQSVSYGGASGPVSISYDFDNPVVVKQVSMKLADQAYSTGMEFTIDGYDGSDWIPLKSVTQKTPSGTSFTLYSYGVDNNVAYTKYRMNITKFYGSAMAWGNTSQTNYWCAVVGALQFYGKDYSEREWDTTHPRRYLYDHGVELSAFEKCNPANGWATITGSTGNFSYNDVSVKKADRLFVGAAGQKLWTGFGLVQNVDLTQYSKVWYNYKPVKYDNDSNRNVQFFTYVTATKDQNNYISQKIAGENYVDMVDVSSVNQSAYISLCRIGSQYAYTANGEDGIYEVWLE